MVNEILDFFGILGLSSTPPATLAELIPYLVSLTVGTVIVCAVIRLVGVVFRSLLDYKRY